MSRVFAPVDRVWGEHHLIAPEPRSSTVYWSQTNEAEINVHLTIISQSLAAVAVAVRVVASEGSRGGPHKASTTTSSACFGFESLIRCCRSGRVVFLSRVIQETLSSSFPGRSRSGVIIGNRFDFN